MKALPGGLLSFFGDWQKSFFFGWAVATIFVAATSLWLFPFTVEQRVWISEPFPTRACWDTGYGFNELQCTTELPVHYRDERTGRQVTMLSFPRFRSVDRIQLKYTAQSSPVNLEIQGARQDLPLRESAPGLFETSLPSPAGSRSVVGWWYFFFGVSLLGALLTSWAQFFRQNYVSDRKFFYLGLAALVALSFVFALAYPGYLNLEEPVWMIVLLARHELDPRYSSLLTFVWGTVHDLFPAAYPFSLYVTEAAAYLLLLLHFLQRLVRTGWPFALAAATLGLLLFTPVALESYFLLARGYSTDYAVFLTGLCAFVMLREEKPVALRRGLLLVALTGVTAALRPENLFFAPVLAIFVLYRQKARGRHVLAFILLLAGIASTLSPESGKRHWISTYLTHATIEPLAYFLRAEPYPFRAEEEEAVKHNMDVESLRHGENDANKIMKEEGSTPGYLKTLAIGTLRAPGVYLQSRVDMLRAYFEKNFRLSPSRVTPLSPNQRLYDLRLWPKEPLEDYVKKGIRGAHWLHELTSYKPYATILPIVATGLVCLLSFWLSLPLAVVGLWAGLRIVFYFFFLPALAPYYLLAPHLFGLFLAVALGREAWERFMRRPLASRQQ